jgi:hypothetical protein
LRLDVFGLAARPGRSMVNAAADVVSRLIHVKRMSKRGFAHGQWFLDRALKDMVVTPVFRLGAGLAVTDLRAVARLTAGAGSGEAGGTGHRGKVTTPSSQCLPADRA